MARPSARDRILDALVAVLLERGPASVTLDAVCERAGVSKGGLLYHFASKADLYAGLTDRLALDVRAHLADAPTDPAELVRWFVVGAVSGDDQESNLWRSLLAGVRADDHEGNPSSTLVSLLEEWGRCLDGLPAPLALQVRLVADGLYFNGLLGTPPPPPDVLEAMIEPLAAAARVGVY